MLIEMAIVLPVFFLLLAGIFTFSMVLFGRGNVICAANAAARYAAVHSATAVVPSTIASVTAYAQSFLIGAPSGGSSVQVTYSAGNTVGGNVTVVVTTTYSAAIPFYGAHPLAVSASAQQIISR